MAKLGIILVILTAIIIFLKKEVLIALHGIKNILTILVMEGQRLLPHVPHIKNIMTVIVVVALAMLLSTIPAYFFWAIKREKFPYTSTTILLLWIILVITFIL